MFDFNNRLLNDKVSLQFWPLPHGLDELLNPIGIPGSNPDKDCPCLEIEFERFSPVVTYPTDSELEKLAVEATNRDSRQSMLALVRIFTFKYYFCSDLCCTKSSEKV